MPCANRSNVPFRSLDNYPLWLHPHRETPWLNINVYYTVRQFVSPHTAIYTYCIRYAPFSSEDPNANTTCASYSLAKKMGQWCDLDRCTLTVKWGHLLIFNDVLSSNARRYGPGYEILPRINRKHEANLRVTTRWVCRGGWKLFYNIITIKKKCRTHQKVINGPI